MKTALENLIVVLKDENTISPYEMCSSGLVQALFTVLNNVSVPFETVTNLQSNVFSETLKLRRLSVCLSVCRVWNWT